MADAYIGSETGALKGVDFSRNIFENFNNVKTLDRTQEISRLCRINSPNISVAGNDDGASNAFSDEVVLCGLVNRQLKLFDPSTGSYTTLCNCDGGRGPIRGVEQLSSGTFVTCVESGELNVWNFDGLYKETSINAGENIWRMRCNPTKASTLATGGRENPLKVWDLHNPSKPVFAAKNVKNDSLDLRVPIWETDIRFSPMNETVFTCTGHHQIRLYDPRTGQRRPVTQIQWGDCPFMCLSLTPRENQVVAGNSKGCMGLFDFRGKGESKLVHCYKGFAGSISSIECHPTELYVASCGIDRFARLHHLLTKEQLNKIYCKSRLNCLLLNNDLSISRMRRRTADDDDESRDVYQSDQDDRASDNDELWNDMGIVGRRKKRGNRHSSSSSVEDVQQPESGGKKNKKKRNLLLESLPAKRTSAPTASDSDGSGSGFGTDSEDKKKRRKKVRRSRNTVTAKRTFSPTPSSPKLRKKRRMAEATEGERRIRKRKALNGDVVAKLSKIKVSECAA